MKQNETKNPQKSPKYFECEVCDYITCNKKDYTKHLLTAKHENETKWKKLSSQWDKKSPNLVCCCGINFNSRTTLWRHKKICENKMNNEYNDIQQKNLIVMLLKENNEIKNIMKDIVKNGSNNTINMISNTKTFNLQFFLNEQCKDAINITDFINSIQVQISELEDIGRLGYVEGISKIIVKNLNNLERNNRPIHCSDTKREIVYIKDDNQWSKDDNDKIKLKLVIKQIANKNIKKIPEWVNENPDCYD